MTYLQDVRFRTELVSLPEVWAKKYVARLKDPSRQFCSLDEAKLRVERAQFLTDSLRPVSAEAWHRTEALLADEVSRHRISADLIDPWAIAKDVHHVYTQALSAYASHISPQQFSVVVAAEIGEIRRKYTQEDPRVIGFVSMQFHYCGQLITAQVEADTEQAILAAYFKVVDDHLYMPLQRAYEAAGSYRFDAPQLQAVHHLLPHSSKIAVTVVDEIHQRYPTHQTHTGQLNSPAVRISSIRDVEMFQVYLWTCVLEQNVSVIAQELFPLCVMLYPKLNVTWDLVRGMLNSLQDAFAEYSHSGDQAYYQPYYDALLKMFSADVLE